MNKKILNIIKKKVDEATPEELDEALKYIENKLKRLGVCVNSEVEDEQ